MKFQLKVLAAALVLSASSLSAQAAMETATSNGNGSFILSVWNAELGSATFDLGYNYNTISNLTGQADLNGSLTMDMTAGNYANAWSFISVASTAPTYWAIFAGDNVGTARTIGSRGYYTTANSTNGMDQMLATAQVTNVLGNMDIYIGAANNVATGNHSSVDDGANTSTLTANSGAGSAFAYGTTGKPGSAGPRASAELGDSLQMLHILTQGTSAPTASFIANSTGNNYTFTLATNGLLTVTAVPEADSYAMLLAGLGVLGLVARRRKA